jgi:hypothetical protein
MPVSVPASGSTTIGMASPPITVFDYVVAALTLHGRRIFEAAKSAALARFATTARQVRRVRFLDRT